MIRQHPIAIFTYLPRNFILLFIPFIRGVMYLRADIESWFRGAYVDFIVLAVIVISAVCTWLAVKYEITENGIKIQKEWVLKQELFLPFKAISSLSSTENLPLKLFNTASITVSTGTRTGFEKSFRHSVRLIVPLIKYIELCNKIPDYKDKTESVYDISKRKLLFFSLVLSSMLSGLVYFSALFIEGGRLVAERIENSFIDIVNDVTHAAEKVISGITPFTAAFIIVLSLGWLVSFMLNFVMHINFAVSRNEKLLLISRGFLSKRRYCINTEKINYVDLKQNFFMKLCGVSSVQISCAGYGKNKNEVPVLMPLIENKNDLKKIRQLLPEMCSAKIAVQAVKKSLLRFAAVPVLLIYGVMAAAFAAIILFPDWYKVTGFLAFMCGIILLHFYAVCLAEYFFCGAGSDGKVLTIKCRNFFQFHNITVPVEKITVLKLRQTLLQKRSSLCDMIIYTENEKVTPYRVRGLDYNEAKRQAAFLMKGCFYEK